MHIVPLGTRGHKTSVLVGHAEGGRRRVSGTGAGNRSTPRQSSQCACSVELVCPSHLKSHSQPWIHQIVYGHEAELREVASGFPAPPAQRRVWTCRSMDWRSR
jgi:hypothetical protein